MTQTGQEITYIQSQEERDKHINEIVDSSSQKKVVVAGPGTGKTYLFKKLLEGKRNVLVLTFVNSLVEDLSLELYGLADVKTLHSYALSELNRIARKKIQISPFVSNTIKEDAEIVLEENIDFKRIFHQKEDSNKWIDFYKKRRVFYDYYGYSDIIYGIVKCYEKNHDRIPTYDLILVDEFQDFNKLEVALIDLLAEKSPILIAGDDDQALYDFKLASTEHIRDRYTKEDFGYTPFTLPSCARCTKVIVDAVNDVIGNAQKRGFLIGRVDKQFKYFKEKKKDEESEHFPKLAYSQIFSTQIPWFIENQLSEFAKDQRRDFSVLVISPYRKQSQQIVDELLKKGYSNCELTIKDESDICLLDGLKLILADSEDNLGWRIASKFMFPPTDFNTLVKLSDSDQVIHLKQLIDTKIQQEVNKILTLLKKVRDNRTLKSEELEYLLNKLKFDSISLIKDALKSSLDSENHKSGIPAIRKLRVKATTIQSSKGLSSELVILTHFDDRFYIKNEDKSVILDQEICNFIVALTRARKKVIMISTAKSKPTFLNWINSERIENVEFKK